MIRIDMDLTYLIAYLVSFTLLGGGMLMYYRFLLSGQGRLTFHRAFLLVLLPLSALFPLWEWPSSLPPPIDLGFTLSPVIIGERTSAPTSAWWQVGMTVYLAGCLFSLMLLARRLLWLGSRIRQLPRSHTYRGIPCLSTRGTMPTASFLCWIFWDDTQPLSDRERKMVLAHEYAHVRLLHSVDLIAMEICQILAWFHPLPYLVRRELIRVHEYQADRYAVRQGDPQTYGALLLRHAMGTRQALFHAFYTARVRTRIRFLTHSGSPAPHRYLGLPLAMLAGVFLIQTFSQTGFSRQSAADLPAKENAMNTFAEGFPPVNAFIAADKEPQPLNLQEIKQAIGYPRIARDAGIEGNVVVRVLVDKDGKYLRHQVLNGVHPLLHQVVEQHLNKLKFTPALKNGAPMRFWVNIPFSFRLLV